MKKLLKMFIATLLISCLILSFNLPVGAQDNTKITNGFYIDGSNNGQKLPPGATIHHFDNGKTEVRDSNNMLLITTSDIDSELIATPGGLMKANHVYHIPTGAIIDNVGNILKIYNDSRVILTVVDDNAADNNENLPQQSANWPIPSTGVGGYVEDGWASGLSPNSFSAEWFCPNNPRNYRSEVVNYIWDGIEDSSCHYLIQPVLQWNGPSGPNGPVIPFYSAQCWYIYPGNSVTSLSTLTVRPGDFCEGDITNEGGSSWYLQFHVTHLGQMSTIGQYIQSSGIPLDSTHGNILFTALESYNRYFGPVYDTDMPPTIIFAGINASRNGQPLIFNWIPYVNSGLFDLLTNLAVSSTNSSSITLQTAGQ